MERFCAENRIGGVGGCSNPRLESGLGSGKGEAIAWKVKAGSVENFHKGFFLSLAETGGWRQNMSLAKEKRKVEREEAPFETNPTGWEYPRRCQVSLSQGRTWTGSQTGHHSQVLVFKRVKDWWF